MDEKCSLSHLTCKVCDNGTLSTKSRFQRTFPVVVIGFILLIASLLGIIFSANMLFTVKRVRPSRLPDQTVEDETFRKLCKDAFLERRAETASLSQVTAPQFCECTLATYKATGSADLSEASRTCAEQGVNGKLKEPDSSVGALYEDDSNQIAREIGTYFERFSGSGFAIPLGIASFVGGLLGRLLVMRRRVLECSNCGKVINAP